MKRCSSDSNSSPHSTQDKSPATSLYNLPKYKIITGWNFTM
jgi:hypothetical protein